MPLGFHIKTFWHNNSIQTFVANFIIIQLVLLSSSISGITLQTENISQEDLQSHIFSDTQKFIVIKFNTNETGQCSKIKLNKELAAVADFYQTNFQPWIGFLQKMLYQNLKIAKIEFPMIVVFRYAKALLPIFLGANFDTTDPIETRLNLQNILGRLSSPKQSSWPMQNFPMPDLLAFGAL